MKRKFVKKEFFFFDCGNCLTELSLRLDKVFEWKDKKTK
jgi:hypothetical protein